MHPFVAHGEFTAYADENGRRSVAIRRNCRIEPLGLAQQLEGDFELVQ